MSTLKLFSLTQMKPSKNFKIDSIADYLEQFSYDTVENFQYIKHQLKVNIKVDKNQNALSGDAEAYDYAAIQNDNDDIVFYYFINSMNWISRSTIQFELLCDTLNTFNAGSDYSLSSRTKVIREHKDRFANPISTSTLFNTYSKIKRIIDFNPEGINPTLQRTISPQSATQENNKWYLVYENRELSTTDVSNPIECKLMHQKTLQENEYTFPCLIESNQLTSRSEIYHIIDGANARAVIYSYGTSVVDSRIVLQATYTKYIVFNNNNGLLRAGYWDRTTGTVTYSMLNTSYAVIYDSDKVWHNDTLVTSGNYNNLYANKDNRYYDNTNINTLNRADSKLIKIIALPCFPYTYDPDEDIEIWTNYDAQFVYKFGSTFSVIANPYASTQWARDLKFDSNPYDNLYVDKSVLVKNASKSETMESKLYHSEFFNPKYYYDSFGTSIALEKEVTTVESKTYPAYHIQSPYYNNKVACITSKGMNSKFLFKVKGANEVMTQEDYPCMFVASRNNELTIYNSAYANYINTGYNYDLKTKQRNVTSSIVGTVTGLASTAASVALAIGTGGVTAPLVAGNIGSTVNSVMGTIHSVAAQEDAIQSKLKQLQEQAATVANCDDLDLLEEYCQNQLKYTEYSLSNQLRNAIYNLFFFYGYAVNEYKVPDTSSRLRFNFIQMEMEIAINNRIKRDEFIEDLKMRYSEGVTIIHKYDNTWDIAQEYENWESFFRNYLN